MHAITDSNANTNAYTDAYTDSNADYNTDASTDASTDANIDANIDANALYFSFYVKNLTLISISEFPVSRGFLQFWREEKDSTIVSEKNEISRKLSSIFSDS